MGLQTFGFGVGCEVIGEPEQDFDRGPGTTRLGDQRSTGDRERANTLAAVQMGLINVNPEGPNGVPDPVASGRDVRETFARMAGNDEETVALVAGAHTFGKAHGAVGPRLVGPEPEGAAIEERGPGWRNAPDTGGGLDTTTSGNEGAGKPDPGRWDDGYFDMLFDDEWDLVKSPAGARQGRAGDVAPEHMIPDAHDPTRRHAPMMATAALSLCFDPGFEPTVRRFRADPAALAAAVARARFRLTPRDMGPRARCLGPKVPAEALIGRDPVPAVDPPRRRGRGGHAQARDPGPWPASRRTRSSSPGPRPRPSAARTSAAGPTGRASGWCRSGTGRPTTGRGRRGFWRPWRPSRPASTPGGATGCGSRWRT